MCARRPSIVGPEGKQGRRVVEAVGTGEGKPTLY